MGTLRVRSGPALGVNAPRVAPTSLFMSPRPAREQVVSLTRLEVSNDLSELPC
jgi:hypothetical protein